MREEWRKPAVVITVLAVFAALIIWKATAETGADASAAGGGDAGASITSVRNDAVADFEAALDTGRPIYLLFHSLTCEPCVEISEVADQVVPEYTDEIVFVNAITDDPSGQELAGSFQFQYIPTSFFLAPDGTVVDAFTGAMDEAQMHGYLDTLAGAQ